MHNLLSLPAGTQYDAELFCASVLADIKRNLCYSKRRNTLRSVCLHFGNAQADDAKQSRQEIARTKATMVVHPVYSHDAAPTDFFLFGYLKDGMAGFTADSSADVLSQIRRIFSEISKETSVAVYEKCIIRLE
jgi:hypothetical protein